MVTVEAAPVLTAPAGPALLEETATLARELSERHAGRTPAQIDELAPARDLYRAFGIDPTKTRPSSEALLRRVLHDKPLPRISNAVDVCNLLSLRFLLPLGLYDAAKIDGQVELRRGLPGESYAGIRKDEVHLDCRPALVDRVGPFGNPTSDSARTSVDESTTSLWLVIFMPASVSTETAARHAEQAAGCMQRHLAPPDRVVTTTTRLLP